MRQATVTEHAAAAGPHPPPRRERLAWMTATVIVLLAAPAIGVAVWAVIDDPDDAAVTREQPPAGATDGEVQWQATVAAGTIPAIAGDDFVLTGQDARGLTEEQAVVRRFDRVTGAEEWTTELDTPLAVPAGVADDVVVVVGDGSISGLDGDEGVVRWQFVTGAVPGSPVALVPTEVETERLFVGGETLSAIDPASGEPLWDLTVEVDQITVADEVVVAAGDGQVHGVEPDTGALRWTHELDNGAPFAVPPVVVNDAVAVASRLGDLAVLDLESGDLRYQVLLDELGAIEEATEPVDRDTDVVEEGVEGPDDEFELDRAVALDAEPEAGVIVVGGESGTIYAFSEDDGERIWDRVVQTDLDVPDAVLIQAEHDLVVVGGPGSQELAAYRLADGLVEWNFELTGEGDADVAPFVGRDYVIAVADSADGRDLVGFDPVDGSEQWRVAVAQQVTAPLLAGDGLVYAVAETADPDEASVLFAVR